MTIQRNIKWKTVNVKPNVKQDLDMACDFLRLTQSEFIEFSLEFFGFIDSKPCTKNRNNPFLNSNFRIEQHLDFERYKLSRK